MKNSNRERSYIIEPLRIRAHTLLCLQGYRGLGYSEEFTVRMDEVADHLKDNPEARIEVITEADIFCEKCPNNENGRCIASQDENHNIQEIDKDKSVEMDLKVLSKLDIEPGSVQVWGEIMRRIGHNVSSTDMDDICGECRWREYPYCADALDLLHRKFNFGENPR